MTKKEIVNELITEYGVDKHKLMKMKLSELESMLEERKKGSAYKDDEKMGKVKLDNIQDMKEDKKVLKEALPNEKDTVTSEVQLNIYETIVRRFDPPKCVLLENLGTGDIYVDDDKKNLICEKNKIKPHTSAIFENISILYITSASRPIVRISYDARCL